MADTLVEFKSRLPEIMAKLPAITHETAVRGAEKIRDRAEEKARMQYDKGAAHTPREESDPSRPFNIEAGSLNEGGAVFADWYYHFGEFGTSRQPARPFLIPALEEIFPEIWGEAGAAIKEL